ncbi:MAG: glycosyltransferase family 9 protein [Desulfobacteraceae bacterium]|nr:MAG: glycosyltransferase family 9 protein [Desulfobacteraceae bacterium]
MDRNPRLLILHQGALGDFIAVFPALRLLRERYPRIDAICRRSLGDLAVELQVIDGRLPLESAIVSTLFSEAVHPELKGRIGTYQSIVLFSYSEELEKSVCSTTDRPVYRIAPRPSPGEPIHVADHVLSLLIRFGLVPSAGFCPIAGGRRIAPVEPAPIFLHPGSGSRLKNWPISNFIRLARMLETKGIQPAFVLGPAEDHLEADLTGRATAAFDRPNDLVDLARLLKTASGFIGNDSGVSHLAAYLGVPTVAIFGPSDPVRWRPLGPAVAVVQPGAECRPCFETKTGRGCRRGCIEEISPQRVLKAYEELRVASCGLRVIPPGVG